MDHTKDNQNSNEDNAPVILDRSRHCISRRDIDPDALKVLYRLRNHGFVAYLVGGAVRDLLLGRKPVDFDIGTNARPNQVKKLFRNAFLVGRRFRLAHVRFQGGKVVEVSTFRKGDDGWDQNEGGTERPEAAAADAALEFREEPGAPDTEFPPAGTVPVTEADIEEVTETVPDAGEGEGRSPEHGRGGLPHKPIAFGTPAEDALRRDLTINALFYDISTFAIIDYTGGLDDLEARRIRIIGDPDERYKEDPVRIWRVLRHAARLGFSIDGPTAEAIPRHLEEIAACPGARLYEELNKDLKSGAAGRFFQAARDHGLFPVILGGLGRFYQDSEPDFARLEKLFSAIDEAIARGEVIPQPTLFAALLEPWASHIMAEMSGPGDRVKTLHEAFQAELTAAQVPKALQFNAFQTHIILGQMLRALETGRMRWNLKNRIQFEAASALCHVVVEGKYTGSPDAFEKIYSERFGKGASGRPHHRGRRPHRKKQPAAGPE